MTAMDWQPSKDQQKALETILDWWDSKPLGVMTLGGLAGTGKSFLMGRLASLLREREVTVAFCAPTGKATIVLEKSLAKWGNQTSCSTVHGLIYRPIEDKKTGRILGWKRNYEMNADLIIVDEASMVSSQMLQDLESFGLPILAVGDHGQLPPVGEEAFLMKDPEIRLEKIHRQARGNPIIRLSTILRNGAPNDAVKGLIDHLDDPRLRYTTDYKIGKSFGAPPGAVLTYTNNLRAYLINDMRHEIHGYTDEDSPQPGETIICLKNIKSPELPMIPNGMRGKVIASKDSGEHTYFMEVEFEPPIGTTKLNVCKHQFLRPSTFKGFDEVPGNHKGYWSTGAFLDFGYVMTVHKFQGSQADDVTVFFERAIDYMPDTDRARWAYTSATRAAKRLTLVLPD